MHSVSCIAGTSMGALVGGGYARHSGSEARVRHRINQEGGWQPGAARPQPIEQKRAGTTCSNEFEFGLTPTAFYTGPRSIPATLKTCYAATWRPRGSDRFDRLPISFRAVATDMVTGTMVVLDQETRHAMRARAIPGAFSQSSWTSRSSDGGLVRNIRSMRAHLCADVCHRSESGRPSVDPKRLQVRCSC
jgi:NTE family protein